MEFRVNNLKELEKVAQWIAAHLSETPIVLFNGAMGSGKTTLISTIMSRLSKGAEVSSPTYSIVQEYRTGRGPVYHFDLYRLDDESELLDLGFEEYLDSGDVCLIEWPDIAMNLLPQAGVLNVDIEVQSDVRIIQLRT